MGTVEEQRQHAVSINEHLFRLHKGLAGNHLQPRQHP